MKKNSWSRGINWLFVLTIVLATVYTGCIDVCASSIPVAPLIIVEKYEITNEKIIPGEDFTLTLTLANLSDDVTAENVLLDVDNPNGVAPVYGTVSQIYIGDVGPGEKLDVAMDYNSWTTITADTLDFHVTTVTSTKQNYIVLRVPAGSDSPFSVVSTNIPETVHTNEMMQFVVAFKVLGEENVKDVSLTLSSDGVRMAESKIGIMTPGSTKTQQVYLNMAQPGEYVFDLALEYVDNTGQTMVSPVETAIVIVNEVEEKVLQSGDDIGQNIQQEEEGMDMMLLMGISGVLILVIFMVVVILLRKNK